MAQIYDNILQTIGRTPLVRLNKIGRDLPGRIVLKLEFFNPCASVKDRIGVSMIEALEKQGRIGPDTVLVEPTSGNTGIGLAFVAAAKGYRLVLTMPETMSMERRRMLQAFGAELVLTEGAKGMKGAIARAARNRRERPEVAYAAGRPVHQSRQSRDPPPDDGRGNLERHRRRRPTSWSPASAPAARSPASAKSSRSASRSSARVAVEPAASPVLSGGQPGPHKIQGIGAGFHPRDPEHQGHRRDHPGDQRGGRRVRAPARARGRHPGRHQLGCRARRRAARSPHARRIVAS